MQHLLCESNKRLQKNFWLNLSMTNKMFKHSDFVTICHVGKKTNRCNLQYYYMHICIFIVNLLFSRKTKNDADRSIINKYSLNLILSKNLVCRAELFPLAQEPCLPGRTLPSCHGHRIVPHHAWLPIRRACCQGHRSQPFPPFSPLTPLPYHPPLLQRG